MKGLRDAPGGTGLYLRRLQAKTHGTPARAAARAARAGVSFVAIMGPWQQPRTRRGRRAVTTTVANRKRFAEYALAFREAGVRVGVWFFPWAGHEERMAGALAALIDGVPVDFLCNDAELGYKWASARRSRRPAGAQGEAIKGPASAGAKGSRSWVTKRARRLVDLTNQLVIRHHMPWGHWFTSYGVAGFHPTFPWQTFAQAADVISPQLYTASPARVRSGISDWWELAGVDLLDAAVTGAPVPYLLPSVGAFGRHSGARMGRRLRFFSELDGDHTVDGAIVWSWRQMARAEWAALTRAGRGFELGGLG